MKKTIEQKIIAELWRIADALQGDFADTRHMRDKIAREHIIKAIRRIEKNKPL